MTTLKTPQAAIQPATEQKTKRKKCKYSGCRKLFSPNRPWQEFCKAECKNNYHNFGSAFGDLTKRGIDRLVKIAAKELEKKLPSITRQYLARLEKRVALLEAAQKERATLTNLESVALSINRRLEKLERANSD